MNAKDIIECNACHICDGELYEGWRVGCDDLVFRAGAEEALKAKEEEMRNRAIEAYKQGCQYYINNECEYCDDVPIPCKMRCLWCAEFVKQLI